MNVQNQAFEPASVLKHGRTSWPEAVVAYARAKKGGTLAGVRPMDVAEAIRELQAERVSFVAIAHELGMRKGWVVNVASITKLPVEVQELFAFVAKPEGWLSLPDAQILANMPARECITRAKTLAGSRRTRVECDRPWQDVADQYVDAKRVGEGAAFSARDLIEAVGYMASHMHTPLADIAEAFGETLAWVRLRTRIHNGFAAEAMPLFDEGLRLNEAISIITQPKCTHRERAKRLIELRVQREKKKPAKKAKRARRTS